MESLDVQALFTATDKRKNVNCSSRFLANIFCFTVGSSLMKVAVRKDGHHFYTHVNYNLEEASGPPLQSKLKEQHKEENKGKCLPSFCS